MGSSYKSPAKEKLNNSMVAKNFLTQGRQALINQITQKRGIQQLFPPSSAGRGDAFTAQDDYSEMGNKVKNQRSMRVHTTAITKRAGMGKHLPVIASVRTSGQNFHNSQVLSSPTDDHKKLDR